MNNKLTRRSFVLRSVQIPLGSALALGLSSCGDEGGTNTATLTVCADPETMSAADASMRASLGYSPQSPDSTENCAGCSYFKSGGDCGACDLLGGSQVNAQGRCNSWSASGD